MKLRNKKTGEIKTSVHLSWFDGSPDRYFESLEQAKEELEEWEDYEPKEPLIKDEKIRKAVRAWAEACNLRYAVYKQSTNEFYDPNTRGRFAIKFLLKPIEVYLNDGECYAIAELCGEEEE